MGEDDESFSDLEGDDDESVLYVTLYRFLCLFGPPDEPDAASNMEEEPEGEEDAADPA